RAQVGHGAVLPEERVESSCRGLRGAHDLPKVIDLLGVGELAAEAAHVDHGPVLPQGGANGSVLRAEDVAKHVDINSDARPQVLKLAVAPQEDVTLPVECLGVAENLPAGVD